MLTVDTSGLRAPVPYPDALARQRSLHADVVAGRSAGSLLLLEHEAVYTAGRRTEPDERPTDGTAVIDVDRGGKLTWHGPGQLVGYPIVRLSDPVDVVAYVRRLEAMLIEVLARFGVAGVQVHGRSGVWLPAGGARSQDEKIAAIGIRVAEGVTMHGFALNCSNSTDAYERIVACGIRDAGVTTISRETGATVTPQDVAPFIPEALEAALSTEILSTTTSTPATTTGAAA
ncbi:lipoyl(octanoyl) transferase LipB [Leifsonia sp. F6_8S_P_1B]|uniref:Octanoyltransferase n=1 Tax=Leifsonia williamsii TaxID=3035919 RepID=A0ABT8KDM2_9MICO|nr:lipoyl(octanoyl) transferase LipB [Leifsonia williamsii]MDN4615566.1 lipoyl(octanoyl) transferase LipB [Leifsonia williamsii]